MASLLDEGRTPAHLCQGVSDFFNRKNVVKEEMKKIPYHEKAYG